MSVLVGLCLAVALVGLLLGVVGLAAGLAARLSRYRHYRRSNPGPSRGWAWSHVR